MKTLTKNQWIILGIVVLASAFLGWLLPNLLIDALLGGRTF